MQGMEEFESAQLVAVRDRNDDAWKLRVAVDRPRPEDDDPLIACWAVEAGSPLARPWAQARPAEDVWPELFLRRTGKAMARMRRQVEWLSEQLDQINRGRDEMCDCPEPELRFPMRPMDCAPEGCAHCWEKASLKAVMEGMDGSES